MQMKLLGTTNVDFGTIDQRLIKFSIFIRYWRKKWVCNGRVHQLFIDLKKPTIHLGGKYFRLF
jgi:hypothetical protein